ncbi:hypothetical protein CL619_00580 [archaeon]|nr:hypothetical protein [archaeon]|tara:strand:+ start:171 stop:1736 length:1566 start_codon:yes stop_codon:yes gene_type:complete
MQIIIGSDLTDKDLLYSTDEARIVTAKGVEALAYPEDEKDLSQLLQDANSSGIPITIIGGKTGINGSCVARHGGIVARMDKMTTVSRLAVETETVFSESTRRNYDLAFLEKQGVFPAGMIMSDLDTILAAKNLWLPPDGTARDSMFGGNIATNVSGARSFAFGPMRDYIQALRVVLPDGDRVTMRRGEIEALGRRIEFETDSGQKHKLVLPSYTMPNTKHAAGLFVQDNMDLIDMFIGSEGILGVITEATVNLVPARESYKILYFFDSLEGGLNFADQARSLKVDKRQYSLEPDSTKGLVSLEFYDSGALSLASGKVQVPSSAVCAIQTEFFCDDMETMEEISLLYEEHSQISDDTTVVDDALIAFRHSVPAAVNEIIGQAKRRYPLIHKVGTDFAVPAGSFREMIRLYLASQEIFQECCRRDQVFAMWGHLGDYHLHANFLPTNGKEHEYALGLFGDLARKAVELEGSISAEHGVGKKNIFGIPLIAMQYGLHALFEIKFVKSVLDPKLVLNKGNMIGYM